MHREHCEPVIKKACGTGEKPNRYIHFKPTSIRVLFFPEHAETPVSPLFITSTSKTSKMSRAQERSKVRCPLFPKSLRVDSRLELNDLCVGERLSPGVPKMANIVKGDDDDEAVCCRGESHKQRKGERDQMKERERGRRRMLKGKDCLFSNWIMVQPSRVSQLGRP